jgi:hypothetical protein
MIENTHPAILLLPDKPSVTLTIGINISLNLGIIIAT